MYLLLVICLTQLTLYCFKSSVWKEPMEERKTEIVFHPSPPSPPQKKD